MFHRIISVVVFYNTKGEILIQERKNMGKQADYGLFGWGKEWDENEKQTAIREIQEELGIKLSSEDLTEIWFTTVEKAWHSRYDVTLFASPWKETYENHVILGEGGWYMWIFPTAMKSLRNIYSIDTVHMDILTQYLSGVDHKTTNDT